MNNLARILESEYLYDLFKMSAKEAAKINTFRSMYKLRYICSYEHRIDFWYSLCDMSTGRCKLVDKLVVRYSYKISLTRLEWFNLSRIYRVKEEFDLRKTWYSQDLGSGGIAKVGDLFVLDKEPDARKKLYRLTKINTKFPYTLQIRPNSFKRYFELVESSDTQ